MIKTQPRIDLNPMADRRLSEAWVPHPLRRALSAPWGPFARSFVSPMNLIRSIAMFKKSKLYPLQDQRPKELPICLEHLQPDCSRFAGWLRRLLGWLEVGHAEAPARSAAAAAELFIPDGCLGLLLRPGEPDRWFQSGRHQLAAEPAKLELRLIPLEFLRERGGAPLALGSELPYERALLFVDGVQVAIVKPGSAPGSSSGGRHVPVRSGVRALPKEQGESASRSRAEEDDLIQDVSFV